MIGNSAYPEPAALANPANDAAAMSAALKTLGFSVVELKDGSRVQMTQAIASVRDSLRGKQAVGMLYYAGHGLQLDWRNYMVPVDARMSAAAEVPAQAVDVDAVMAAFKAAGNRMNIVVLDACRDNPFAGTGSGKGLAQVDAPAGTFMAYATAPGNVAEDGSGSNGLYTSFLVQELTKPAAKIEDVFKRVRLQVRQKSQGRQIPWESTSLEEDFFFNDGVKFTFRPEDLQRLTSAALDRQKQLERDAQQAQEKEAQQAAAKQLAELREAELRRLKELEIAMAQAAEAQRLKRLSAAQAREQAFAAEKTEWDRIKLSKIVDDLYAFTSKYPSGGMAELAQARIELLQRAQIQPQPDRNGKMQLPFYRRHQDGDRYEFVQKDGLTGLVNGRGVMEIKVRGEDDIESVALSGNLPGGRSNIAGFIFEDAGGSYDPPWTAVA